MDCGSSSSSSSSSAAVVRVGGSRGGSSAAEPAVWCVLYLCALAGLVCDWARTHRRRQAELAGAATLLGAGTHGGARHRGTRTGVRVALSGAADRAAGAGARGEGDDEGGPLAARTATVFRVGLALFLLVRGAWWVTEAAEGAGAHVAGRVLNRVALALFLVVFGLLVFLALDALALAHSRGGRVGSSGAGGSAAQRAAAAKFAPQAIAGTLGASFMSPAARAVFWGITGTSCLAIFVLALVDIGITSHGRRTTVLSSSSSSSWASSASGCWNSSSSISSGDGGDEDNGGRAETPFYVASVACAACVNAAYAVLWGYTGVGLVRMMRDAAVSARALVKVAVYCALLAACFLCRALFFSCNIVFHRQLPEVLFHTLAYGIPELVPTALFVWMSHESISDDESSSWRTLTAQASRHDRQRRLAQPLLDTTPGIGSSSIVTGGTGGGATRTGESPGSTPSGAWSVTVQPSDSTARASGASLKKGFGYLDDYDEEEDDDSDDEDGCTTAACAATPSAAMQSGRQILYDDF